MSSLNDSNSIKRRRFSTKDFITKYAMIFVLFAVLGVFGGLTRGGIVAPSNITNLISQNAYVFVLATGMLLCILTGGNIDLSVGSVVCFVGAVGAILMVKTNVPLPLIILVMFLVGTAIGAVQAMCIANIRIPPFIVTLAGMLIFRGLSNVVLSGQTVSIDKQQTFMKIFGGGAKCFVPDAFAYLAKAFGTEVRDVSYVGNGLIGEYDEAGALTKLYFRIGGEQNMKFNALCFIVGIVAVAIFVYITVSSRRKRIKKGLDVDGKIGFIVKTVLISAAVIAVMTLLSLDRGIPSALVIIVAVVFIYTYITGNTTTGRYFYAVGGNEKATKLSGINTNKVYFLAYTNMGFLSALAGMLAIARLSAATPSIGDGFEMDAIASCFIGGASAYGGIGTVPGVIIGALLMGVINLGMMSIGVDQNMQKVVKGLVLLAAVIFDVVSKRNGKFFVKG